MGFAIGLTGPYIRVVSFMVVVFYQVYAMTCYMVVIL